jgi:UDP-N-acetylmuramoyl-L-alanine---L-glutamate ligase
MNEFTSFFIDKKILILGFGLEGKSTFKTIRSFLPELVIAIADARSDLPDVFKSEFGNDAYVKFHCGDNYLEFLNDYDVVIKSPGISYKVLNNIKTEITSQTEIFIKLFKNQIVGITGTKGKSTTTSLLLYILKKANKNALLAGNIGIPPFDYIKEIKQDTIIAYEMSSHQLENITISPHIAILLNIYQEHLDHYSGYEAYQHAKFNICKWQNNNDIFIANFNNEVIKNAKESLLGNGKKILLDNKKGVFCSNDDVHLTTNGDEIVFEGICKRRKLLGAHNLLNIQAAIVAAYFVGVKKEVIIDGVADFAGLPHRLEQVANIGGAIFINDSISTIPEATIAALSTFENTKTLILGGFDRGINYDDLVDFLSKNAVKNLIFVGGAGKRIFDAFAERHPNHDKNCLLPNSFDEAVKASVEVTLPGEICLLSPAAASYDTFKNFMERGDRFRLLLNKTP